jgi:hypothetical protein
MRVLSRAPAGRMSKFSEAAWTALRKLSERKASGG